MNSLPLTERWLDHFMHMAQLCASMSKDPSTKVGSVIVRLDRTVASTGYNGYPRPCDDSDYHDRTRKYQRIIHAEMNAILQSAEDLHGYTLFVWPMPPCDRCMPHIIQSGISKLVVPAIHPSDRWFESCQTSINMAHEAGITVVTWEPK